MDIAPASRRWRVVLVLALLGATGSASAIPAEALPPVAANDVVDRGTDNLVRQSPLLETGRIVRPASELPTTEEPTERLAAWPPWLRGRRPLYGGGPGPAATLPDTPHPAVARIIVPEDGATAYGSGTLIDVRDQFGLVVTNWHVVRDSQGTVEVVFPNGFRSHARPLKVDSDWDLAALVIWRPAIEPVRVSQSPPRPGDLLTIHGYGQGKYRIATGRCTAYYAPKRNYPQEMVELDVEARQGDSGGPIFNQQGELAGVLFGAGEGTTIGSFAPRVESFLASLAPDIGAARDQAQLAVADRPAPEVHPTNQGVDANFAKHATWPSSPWQSPTLASNTSATATAASGQFKQTIAETPTDDNDLHGGLWFERIKSGLAVLGLIVIGLQLMRIVK